MSRLGPPADAARRCAASNQVSGGVTRASVSKANGADRRNEPALSSRGSAHSLHFEAIMIRKLAGGKYRLLARKKDPRTGRRRNLGTFSTRTAAERHERAIQYFKRRS
jgi:hypothetical protein